MSNVSNVPEAGGPPTPPTRAAQPQSQGLEGRPAGRLPWLLGVGGTGAVGVPRPRACLPGVSAQAFLHCFPLAGAAFSLQVPTPGEDPGLGGRE